MYLNFDSLGDVGREYPSYSEGSGGTVEWVLVSWMANVIFCHYSHTVLYGNQDLTTTQLLELKVHLPQF